MVSSDILKSFQGDNIPTPNEIKKLIDDQERDLQTVYDRMDSDYNLYTLKKYSPEKALDQAYTSNEPRTFADKLISLGSQATLKIAISWSEGEAKREQGSLVEQFLRGVLYEADNNLLRRMHPRLIPSLFYYTCIRGFVLPVRVVVNKDEQENVIWDILPIDPRNFFFEMGTRRPIWCASRRIAKAKAISKEYGVEVIASNQNNYVTVIDYWDEKVGITICTNPLLALKEPEEHGIGHPPFCLGVIGSEPASLISQDDTNLEHFGESIYASNRAINDNLNKTLSWAMDIVHDNRRPYREFETELGEAAPEDVGKSGKIQPVRKGEGIKVVQTPTMPPDTGNLLGIMVGERQRGSIPSVSYGEGTANISGYAINLLTSPIKAIMTEKGQVVADVIESVCREVITQYSAGGFMPTTVKGVDKSRKLFIAKISPEQVKGDWLIKVDLDTGLPQDEMGKMTMASMAKKNRLLSEDTIAEKYLGIEDIDAENKRKLTDFGNTMSPVMLFDLIRKLRESQDEGDQMKAQMLMAELQRMTGGVVGGMLGQPPQAPPMPQQPMPQQGPQGVVPQGIPPQVQPPQDMGAPPMAPGQMGSQAVPPQGIPPGMGGR